MPRIRLTIGALLTFLCTTAPSHASEFETYCGLDGFTAPARQTIVVIDERHITAEGDKKNLPQNAEWRRFIGNVLFSNPQIIEQNFLPRERITIAIARKDGAGMRQVFTGCLPFYSSAERTKIARDAGGIVQGFNTFTGMGPTARAKKDMDLFRIRVGDGFKDALQPSVLSSSSKTNGDIAQSGLIASMKQGKIVNMNYGIPRIIIYSDLARYFPATADRADARQVGLTEGREADLNLSGAEVHVLGLSGNTSARDALEMFFLASNSELVSAGSSSSMPSLTQNPVRVLRYQGTIDYPEMRFPIRIRLATDQNGTVMNSWVFVQSSSEQYSPFHGVLTCSDDGTCQYSGDDVFAQVWNVHRTVSGEPKLAIDLAFGGARSFKLAIAGDTATGSISDPQIKFQGLADGQLKFTARLQKAALF